MTLPLDQDPLARAVRALSRREPALRAAVRRHGLPLAIGFSRQKGGEIRPP